MSDITVLRELLIVVAVTFSIVFFFQQLRLPAIIGFLLAGVIIGPNGLKIIPDLKQVEILAEIGVILLLFEIGLEFSIAGLLSVYRSILWGGVLQIAITTLVVWTLALFMGFPSGMGIFYGFLISLSSTAIVLKIYSDRGETHALHARLATGVLLFQDLCIIPMMLLVPFLGRSAPISLARIGLTLGQALLVVLSIIIGARFALPWVLHQVARLRNRELFILFVVFFSLGTAWLTSQFGLSLALGAFIAGLVISELEYSHQIVSDILPLRDCFTGIFFISIGMLLDVGFLFTDVSTPVGAFVALVAIKALVVLGIFGWLYRSLRLGVVLALSLAQVGEFSFILAAVGREHGLVTAAGEQLFLAATILSMIASPFLVQWAHGLAFRFEEMLRPESAGTLPEGEGGEENRGPSTGHVIVIGYGLNGQNLTRVLKEVGIAYRILDMDPDVVRRARTAGEPIWFGDGTRPEVLRQLGIQDARVVVAAISDRVGTARIVSQARRLRPDVYLIVRTRYLAEIEHLDQLGANQVIPEEFETSVEIFARVLQEYHVPRNVISLQVELIRKEHYGTLRGLHLQGKRLDELSRFLAGTTADTFLIPEGSPVIGKSLEEIDLRSRAGVTLISVVRGGESIYNPGREFLLAAGDVLVLLGSHKALDQATQILSPPNAIGGAAPD
ncbi:MAG: cation:proton antiporter [Deltaproteobacteria bacterium]|nr:cation:proton antiporter [Deltaproteobacteria bacterium]